MKTTIQYRSRKYTIDFTQPIDISIPLHGDVTNVNAWYIGPPKITAEVIDGNTISVAEGASINFNSITFNPHAHGTHTECVGHIIDTKETINSCLKQYLFLAELITVAPEKQGDDFVISKQQLQFLLGNKKREALVVRTIPNLNDKLSQHYSNTNWPYFTEEAITYLVSKGIQHLLVDLPSIDKEQDEGVLAGHNAFWNTAGAIRYNATITEFIFVPNPVKDGTYFVNLQVAPFKNDAAPSRPVLYNIID